MGPKNFIASKVCVLIIIYILRPGIITKISIFCTHGVYVCVFRIVLKINNCYFTLCLVFLVSTLGVLDEAETELFVCRIQRGLM